MEKKKEQNDRETHYQLMLGRKCLYVAMERLVDDREQWLWRQGEAVD